MRDVIHCCEVLRCWQGPWPQCYCNLLTSLLMEELWEVPKLLIIGLWEGVSGKDLAHLPFPTPLLAGVGAWAPSWVNLCSDAERQCP